MRLLSRVWIVLWLSADWHNRLPAPPPNEAPPYRFPSRAMGLRPDVDLTRALRLDAGLHDDEVVRKLHLRK